MPYTWQAYPPQEPINDRPQGAVTYHEEDDGATVVTQISGYHCTTIMSRLLSEFAAEAGGNQRQWVKDIDGLSMNTDWENWPD